MNAGSVIGSRVRSIGSSAMAPESAWSAAAPQEAACTATPGPAKMKAVTTATSQCLPDIPGLPDRDSVEEWLSVLVGKGEKAVCAAHAQTAILSGSSL